MTKKTVDLARRTVGLKAQEQDPARGELSFVERLSLLLDQQWNWRENQALTRRLKSAKLRHNACVEDIDYRAARGLEKTVVRGLAKDSQWVQNHENLFVLGPTGVGKSFIACALAQKACRDGYSASTQGRRRCSVIWPWHARTEASAICSGG